MSPGVPLDSPQLAPARAAGLPIIGELELGWRAVEAETIAITGTNGKTTTTALTGALLGRAARGRCWWPATSALRWPAHALTFPPDGVVVCEVSSFQLETIDTSIRAWRSCSTSRPITSIGTGRSTAYLDAKARIFLNQTETDCAVLNADDEVDPRAGRAHARRVVWFSRRRPAGPRRVRARRLDRGQAQRPRGADLPAGRDLPARRAQRGERPGRHRVRALARASAPAAIRRGIAPLPRRSRTGSSSCATCAASTTTTTPRAPTSPPRSRRWRASRSAIVLIAGGKGKGQDFAPLAEAARGRVRPRGRDRPGRAADRRGARRRRHRRELRASRWRRRSHTARAARRPRRRRAPVARLRLLRHVRQLRAPRRRVQRPRRRARASSRGIVPRSDRWGGWGRSGTAPPSN